MARWAQAGRIVTRVRRYPAREHSGLGGALGEAGKYTMHNSKAIMMVVACGLCTKSNSRHTNFVLFIGAMA